jgi:hypothetical protein
VSRKVQTGTCWTRFGNERSFVRAVDLELARHPGVSPLYANPRRLPRALRCGPAELRHFYLLRAIFMRPLPRGTEFL